MWFDGVDRDVLAMIAKIEYQHVEVGQQMLPVRIVGIGRKAVAVRDQEPHAVGIAVPPHPNARAVLERNIEGLAAAQEFRTASDASPASAI